MHAIHLLKSRKLIHNLPVFLNSPMAAAATRVHAGFAQEHRLTDAQVEAMRNEVTVVETPDGSRALHAMHGPLIIIAASGMATGGTSTRLQPGPVKLVRPATTSMEIAMNGAILRVSAAMAFLVAAFAQPAAGQGRGELLYARDCQLCHSQQVHWRDNRLATDWGSLVAQVRRWQEAGRLGWSEEDIRLVARYLNGSIYKFPENADSLTLAQGSVMRNLPAPFAEGSPAAARGFRQTP